MIGLGYAVELLAMFSRLPRKDWAESIAEEANKRFRELSDREVEKIIEIAQNGRGNSIGFTLGNINEEGGGGVMKRVIKKVEKQEYVVNVVGLGYAIELLARISGIPAEGWAEKITEEANNRVDEMSEEQINQLVNYHKSYKKPAKGFSLSRIKINEKSN